MTLPALAEVSDLEARLGVAIDNVSQADALLSYTSALIRSYTNLTYVDDDDHLDDPLPNGVREVTVEAVVRALQNPAGVTQDTTGPFSVSFGSDAAQRVYLTKADKRILRGGNLAFTIDPTPELATDFSTLDDFYFDIESS